MLKYLTKPRAKTACTAAIAALLLAGCGPSPLLRVGTKLGNFGMELDPGMVQVNLVGMVGFDEGFAGSMHRLERNILYMAGAVEGTPEYRYRVVRITLRQIKGLAHISDGAFVYPTAAMAPDSMPALKAWDIVEVRQTGTYDVLKGFAREGEGNAILRVLCRKSDPGYEACAEALPRIGKFRAQGPTGTPYRSSLKEYGLKFSMAYDEGGQLLRPLPK